MGYEAKKTEHTGPKKGSGAYWGKFFFYVLREKLGLKRYGKMAKRDKEEREILLNLALKKIEEKDDFILLGYRRRKVKIT